MLLKREELGGYEKEQPKKYAANNSNNQANREGKEKRRNIYHVQTRKKGKDFKK